MVAFLIVAADFTVAGPASAAAEPTESGRPEGWRPTVVLNDLPVEGPRDLSLGIADNGKGYAIYARRAGDFDRIWGSRLAPDGGWSTTYLLPQGMEGLAFGNATAPVDTPKLAVGANDSAVSVWRLQTAAGFRLHAAFANASQAWQGDIEVPNAGGGDVTTFAVGMDGGGWATIVYRQDGALAPDIWAVRGNGSNWSQPQLIEASPDPPGPPVLAVARGGDALAAWSSGVPASLVVARYAPSFGWNAAESLNTTTAESVTPAVAIVDGGWGVAAFVAYQGRARVSARTYNISAGWGAPQELETDQNRSGSPRLAIAGGGRIEAIWTEDFTPGLINYNHYEPALGWGAAQPLTRGQGFPPASLSLGTDASGNAVALWAQSDGVSSRPYASRRISGANWTAPSAIGEGSPPNSCCTGLAVSASGEVLAAWTTGSGGQAHAWGSRANASTSWGLTRVIDVDGGAYVSEPAVAMNRHGVGLAAWGHDRGVVAREYTDSAGWTSAHQPLASVPGGPLFSRAYVAVEGGGLGALLSTEYASLREDIWSVWHGSDGVWGSPQQLTFGARATLLGVWASDGGTFVAIWADTSRISTFATVALPGTSWGAIVKINPPCGGSCSYSIPFSPKVGFAPNGDIWVALASAAGVEVAHFVPGAGWLATEVLDDHDTVPMVDLVVHDNGNVTVGWSVWEGNLNEYWISSYNSSTGWQGPQRIYAGPADSLSRFALAGDGRGNLTLVVGETRTAGAFPDSNSTVYAVTFSPTAGWASPAGLGPTVSGHVNVLNVCIDAADRALAVWSRADGASSVAEYATRDAAHAWSPPMALREAAGLGIADGGLGPYADRFLICAGQGSAFLRLWGSGTVGTYSAAARRYTASDLWAPSLQVQAPFNNTVVGTPTVVVRGKTEPGATVTVNGLAMDVSTTGAFSGLVGISSGVTNLTVTATDAWGNSASAVVAVRFVDAGADALAALQGILDNLSATQLEVDGLQAAVAQMAVDLAAAASAIDGNASRLDDVYARLDDVAGRLDNASADVAATAGNVTDVAEALERAWEALNETRALVEAGVEVDPALWASLNATEAALQSASATLDSHTASLAALDENVDGLSTSLADARTRANTAQANQNATADRVATEAARTAALEAALGSLQALAIVALAVAGAAMAVSFVTLRKRTRPPPEG